MLELHPHTDMPIVGCYAYFDDSKDSKKQLAVLGAEIVGNEVRTYGDASEVCVNPPYARMLPEDAIGLVEPLRVLGDVARLSPIHGQRRVCRRSKPLVLGIPRIACVCATGQQDSDHESE